MKRWINKIYHLLSQFLLSPFGLLFISIAAIHLLYLGLSPVIYGVEITLDMLATVLLVDAGATFAFLYALESVVTYVNLRMKPATEDMIRREEAALMLFTLIVSIIDFFLPLVPGIILSSELEFYLRYLVFIVSIIFPLIYALRDLGILSDSSLRIWSRVMIMTWCISVILGFYDRFSPIEVVKKPFLYAGLYLGICLLSVLYNGLKFIFLTRYGENPFYVAIYGPKEDTDKFERCLRAMDIKYTKQRNLMEDLKRRVRGFRRRYTFITFEVFGTLIDVLKAISAWLKECKDPSSYAEYWEPYIWLPYRERIKCRRDDVGFIDLTVKLFGSMSRLQALKTALGFNNREIERSDAQNATPSKVWQMYEDLENMLSKVYEDLEVKFTLEYVSMRANGKEVGKVIIKRDGLVISLKGKEWYPTTDDYERNAWNRMLTEIREECHRG